MASCRNDRTDRFKILYRDGFACRYCGARPGSYFLEVDHLVPRSRGGSDHESNKVAACKTCNSRKSDAIVFPHDLIERPDEEEGWVIHKTYGPWSIVFSDEHIGVQKQNYGFIEGRRMFDSELTTHLYSKPWSEDVFRDMEMAFGHLSNMLKNPYC